MWELCEFCTAFSDLVSAIAVIGILFEWNSIHDIRKMDTHRGQDFFFLSSAAASTHILIHDGNTSLKSFIWFYNFGLWRKHHKFLQFSYWQLKNPKNILKRVYSKMGFKDLHKTYLFHHHSRCRKKSSKLNTEGSSHTLVLDCPSFPLFCTVFLATVASKMYRVWNTWEGKLLYKKTTTKPKELLE